MHSMRLKQLAGSLAVSLVVAACASNRPAAVSPQLTAVRQSIDQAQQADAQHYATRELNMARDKLQLAEEASQKGDDATAARLATRAKLDAEYAMAVAQNKDAQVAVDTLNKTLQTLRNEVQSQPAGTQPPPSPEPGAAQESPPAR